MANKWTPMTFREWIAANPELDSLEDIECDECGGTGEHICSCGHEHECPECQGEGKFDARRDAYDKQLTIDKMKFEAWEKATKHNGGNHGVQAG